MHSIVGLPVSGLYVGAYACIVEIPPPPPDFVMGHFELKFVLVKNH
jgi:hypothetical protein